jgi:hypothetical protein
MHRYVDDIKKDIEMGLGEILLMHPSGHGPVAGFCEQGNEPFGFNKMWGIFRLVMKLLVSEESLCSMELFW